MTRRLAQSIEDNKIRGDDRLGRENDQITRSLPTEKIHSNFSHQNTPQTTSKPCPMHEITGQMRGVLSMPRIPNDD